MHQNNRLKRAWFSMMCVALFELARRLDAHLIDDGHPTSLLNQSLVAQSMIDAHIEKVEREISS